MVVRSLLNGGYSNIHVRLMKPLIIRDYTKEAIVDFFSEDTRTDDIIDQMGIGA